MHCPIHPFAGRALVSSATFRDGMKTLGDEHQAALAAQEKRLLQQQKTALDKALADQKREILESIGEKHAGVLGCTCRPVATSSSGTEKQETQCMNKAHVVYSKMGCILHHRARATLLSSDHLFCGGCFMQARANISRHTEVFLPVLQGKACQHAKRP
jgi:hypothetical protein